MEMKVSLFGDWAKAKDALLTLEQGFKRAGERAVLKEAHFLRGKIVEGFREQAPGGQPFEPLAPSTLAIRKGTGFGGTKALIERGDLRNSISVVKTGEGAFVGVKRTATSRDGKSLLNIAKIHEEGSSTFVVPITPRSSRYYHAMLRKAGMDIDAKGEHHTIAIIRIPARPFLRPVFEKFAKPDEVRARFYANLTAELAGPFATET